MFSNAHNRDLCENLLAIFLYYSDVLFGDVISHFIRSISYLNTKSWIRSEMWLLRWIRIDVFCSIAKNHANGTKKSRINWFFYSSFSSQISWYRTFIKQVTVNSASFYRSILLQSKADFNGQKWNATRVNEWGKYEPFFRKKSRGLKGRAHFGLFWNGVEDKHSRKSL